MRQDILPHAHAVLIIHQNYHDMPNTYSIMSELELIINLIIIISKLDLGADYMDRASPVNRAEKCHENLPWAAK
jgi:hypothetical protein